MRFHRFLIVPLLALSLPCCTPAQRGAAAPAIGAVGKVACALVPILVGPDGGTFAGAVCSDLLGVVTTTLLTLPAATAHAATAPCDVVAIARPDGTFAGVMCAGYAEAATKAVAGAATR